MSNRCCGGSGIVLRSRRLTTANGYSSGRVRSMISAAPLGQQFEPYQPAEFARSIGRTGALGLDEAAAVLLDHCRAQREFRTRQPWHVRRSANCSGR